MPLADELVGGVDVGGLGDLGGLLGGRASLGLRGRLGHGLLRLLLVGHREWSGRGRAVEVLGGRALRWNASTREARAYVMQAAQKEKARSAARKERSKAGKRAQEAEKEFRKALTGQGRVK